MEEEKLDISKCVDLHSTIDWLIEINKGIPEFTEWSLMDEDGAVLLGHHGFGRWIRNTLELWGDGLMVKYFNDIGIFHADDMSAIITTTLHRTLNNVKDPLEIVFQVKKYIKYWAKVDPKVNTGDFENE